MIPNVSQDCGEVKMSDEMKKAMTALQMAVDRELERKAKLGFKAVVADKHGNPNLVSAKYLVRKKKSSCSSVRTAD